MKLFWMMIVFGLVCSEVAVGQEKVEEGAGDEVRELSVAEVFVEAAVLKPRGCGESLWGSEPYWLRNLVESKKEEFGVTEEGWARIRKSYKKPEDIPGIDGKLELLIYEVMGADGCLKAAPFMLKKEGLAACSRHCLAQHLTLDEDQQKRIREINEKSFSDFIQPYGRLLFTNSDPVERVYAATAAREKSKQVDREILDVLNDEQKKKLEPLLRDALKMIEKEEFGQARR